MIYIWIYNYCFILLDFRTFVKTSLTNLKYEMKVLLYGIDFIKAQVSQQLDISSRASEINSVNDEELPWPITNFKELDNRKKVAGSKN